MAFRPRDVELEMVIQKLVATGDESASPSRTHRTHQAHPNRHTHSTRCDAALKILRHLPKFISSVVLLMIIAYIAASGRCVVYALQWSPGPWWQQPWRILTHGMLHRDIKHLVGNLLSTIVLGSILEVEQGWWRVGAVWWGGVAAGAAGAAMSHPGDMMVGSSAAVFALATSHLPHVCYRYKSMRWPLLRLVFLALYCAAVILEHLLYQAPSSRIAFASHYAGMVAGLLLGFVVFTDKGDGGRPTLTVLCRCASAAVASGCSLAAGYCAAVRVTAHHIVADNIYHDCQSDLIEKNSIS